MPLPLSRRDQMQPNRRGADYADCHAIRPAELEGGRHALAGHGTDTLQEGHVRRHRRYAFRQRSGVDVTGHDRHVFHGHPLRMVREIKGNRTGHAGVNAKNATRACHALPAVPVPLNIRRTKSCRSALCSAAETLRRRLLPMSSMVLRMAVGERVADGDIASVPASTVSSAWVASPVLMTMALASLTNEASKMAVVMASISTVS